MPRPPTSQKQYSSPKFIPCAQKNDNRGANSSIFKPDFIPDEGIEDKGIIITSDTEIQVFVHWYQVSNDQFDDVYEVLKKSALKQMPILSLLFFSRRTETEWEAMSIRE